MASPTSFRGLGHPIFQHFFSPDDPVVNYRKSRLCCFFKVLAKSQCFYEGAKKYVMLCVGESGFCLAPLTPFGKAIFNLVSPLFSFVMLAVILGVHYCVVEFQCCSCLRNSGFLKTLGNGCTAVVQLFYNLLKFIFGIPLMAVKWMIDASCCRYRQTSWTKQIAARIVDQFEIEEREDNRPEREKLFDSYVRTFGGLCMWR